MRAVGRCIPIRRRRSTSCVVASEVVEVAEIGGERNAWHAGVMAPSSCTVATV